jgi:hypothetical protein
VLTAAATELEIEDEDRERFAIAALPVIRRLLELGFLARSNAGTA